MYEAPLTDGLPFDVLPAEFTALSAYSGAGGMDLGFAWAGFEPVWANDFFEAATRTYARNLGEHVHYGDVLSATFPQLKPDIVIGGPPCQSFSRAGKMDPTDPRGNHVFTFMDVVARYQPRAFVLENVKALAEGPRFELIRKQLIARAEHMGYSTNLMLLNAAHYDVPQARERMFLVGHLGAPVAVPAPTTLERPPTVRDALSALPPYGEPGNDSLCRAIITPAKSPVLRVSPFAGMLFNGAGRPLDPDAPSCTLPASMGGNRTPIIDQAEWDHGEESWVREYHRHLRAGGEMTGEIPDRLRRLTVQEASAIQTFPRDWVFDGPQSLQFRQIGNAVPPRLAYHVGRAVRDALVAE